MFGFSKEEKLCTEIGEYLHRSIRGELLDNERTAGMRVGDMFTSAYIFSFITSVAEHKDFDGDKFRDSNLKKICNGVLPNRLYDAVVRNSAVMELASDLDNDITQDQKSLFQNGITLGNGDAMIHSHDPNPHRNTSLFLYLSDWRDEDGTGILDMLQEEDTSSAPDESLEHVAEVCDTSKSNGEDQQISSMLTNQDKSAAIKSNNEADNPSENIEERLAFIKNLLEKGLITEDQADLKRRNLLSQL